MLKYLKWFFRLFSRYANSFEKKVDKFFKNIKSTDSIADINKNLLKLMQKNLIVVNIWLEKKYKGYKYLSKGARKNMYENANIIVKKFQEFSSAKQSSINNLKKELSEKGLQFPTGDEDKIKYLYEIMQFLKPGLYYKYIKTASFGKLLRDPNKNKLEGDCNQIVTLYIYLFSLRFSIDDLEIKLLPEHVCLHFRGIDIEATHGMFQKYREKDQILPVTEIISTNLLDLTDYREELQNISSRVMVKSAQLAYAVSSLKPLVAKNLNIAYRNLAGGAMMANDFDTAIFYYSKAGDREALRRAYRNAAIYYMKNNNFSKAYYFAGRSGDRDLEKNVKYNEGVYYYNEDILDKALSIFSVLGEEKMKKSCYAKMYKNLAKKVSGVKTVKAARRHKSTYRKMLGLAKKMGNSRLERGIRDTLRKL
ncbi:MAG: hypothetical protein GF353_22435 [Candidatus Lokiarchaeota archaeon]|nr:hypothetical protein [Candidatus Lokiarchaeota archaeon]